jgi:hypothetical protein
MPGETLLQPKLDTKPARLSTNHARDMETLPFRARLKHVVDSIARRLNGE